MFFEFNQNNSGGSFVKNDAEGIGHYVIIEATDAAHANIRAEEIGLYFDGCDKGWDCDCCGDRWSRADYTEPTDKPTIYGQPVFEEDGEVEDWFSKYGSKEGFVHYLDGSFKAFSI